MQIQKRDTVPIQIDTDVVRVRQAVRSVAIEFQFSLVEQTKIITAASELARNTLIHGKGGIFTLETIQYENKNGLRLSFSDEGPGIPDIELALKDGYTSGGGLGMGLPGAKRLANEFEISSVVGKGTRVTITKWKGR